MSKRRVFAAGILIGICVSLAAVFFIKSYLDYSEYDTGDDSYRELFEKVTRDDGIDETPHNSDNLKDSGNSPDPLPLSGSDAEDTENISDAILPEIDFKKLKEVNSDIAAWLYAPGTPINYPVVQCADDEYYLNHLFDGTKNKNGCLFIEKKNRTDFSDDNTIIYGHNMASGSMFAELLEYKDPSYAKEHPYLYLITEDASYRIEVFSAHVTEPESDAYDIRLGTAENFRAWILKMANRSSFSVNIKMTTKERIITLSTCSYEYKNARFVVHGRMVKM